MEYHENASENLISILSQCFTIDPNERITSGDIINHNFFRQVNEAYKQLNPKIVYAAFMSCRHFKPKFLF